MSAYNPSDPHDDLWHVSKQRHQPDDAPGWVRKIVRNQWYMQPQREPDEPLPNITDTQERCAICGCFVLDPNAQTCMLHRQAESLRQNVRSGVVTDWPANLDHCGTQTMHHVRGMTSTCKTHWIGSVKYVLAMYNGLNGTRYRFA